MTDNAGRSGSSWVGPGVLLVVATAVISGCSTFLNAYAVQGTSSAAFVTVRNVAVAAILVPIAGVVLWRARSRPSAKEIGTLAVIGLVGGAIPFLLFFRGIQLATEAHGALTASFVYRTLFLFATVFGIVALHERFRPRLAAAAALVLGGNLLLLSLVSPIWTDGSLYVLVATVLWAAEYTISKRVLRTLRGTTVALGRMGFGAVFLSVYLAATGGWSVVAAYGPPQWTWVLISGALLTGFVLTWYTGLARVDLGVATTVLVLAFPISWALGVVATGAPVPPATVFGAAVIAVGVLLALGTGALRATWTYLARRAPAPVLT